MKWFSWIKRSARKSRSEADETQELLEIARSVEQLTESLVGRLFARYYPVLMAQHITFIVPAVWGATKSGELEPDQKAMHEEIAPVIDRITAVLNTRDLSPPQAFAVGYLIRSQIISKIVYMIEAAKRRRAEDLHRQHSVPGGLEDIEPVGRA